MTRPSLAISCDLDGPPEYASLHGLEVDGGNPGVMFGAPLSRFAELCQDLGAPGTLFVVTRDLGGDAALALGRLAEQGFELASHSHRHDYWLAKRAGREIRNDLRAALSTFRSELGHRPRGFRAPGYGVSEDLLDGLVGEGFVYDSSVLPSPPYYAAKLAVMAAYRLTGRSTAAVRASAKSMAAPLDPYRPGQSPFVRGDRDILELPLAVATRARLPVTGASLVVAPAVLRHALVRGLRRREVVVINLHAIDLLDPDRDGLPREICDRQPELRVSLAQRQGILRDTLGAIAAHRRIGTCAEIATV